MKSSLQKITPFAGMALMMFSSFFRYGYVFFSEICSLVLIFCSLILIIAQYHQIKKSSTECNIFSLSSWIMTFIVGIIYSLFIGTSLEILDHTESFELSSLWSLSSLFLVCWASLIQRAKLLHDDPVICYAYWPKFLILRLPGLVSYYASSNGLFILILCCTWFFVFDHLLLLPRIYNFDTGYMLIY
jgi:hypothetical protein